MPDTKLYLDYAEFYITNVYNLTCQGCNRFNNVKFKGWQGWNTFAWDEHIKEWCSWEDAGYFSHEHPTPRANQEFAQDLRSSVERWLDGQKK